MSLSKFQAGCLLFSAVGIGLAVAYYTSPHRHPRIPYESLLPSISSLDFSTFPLPASASDTLAHIHTDRHAHIHSHTGILTKACIADVYAAVVCACRDQFRRLAVKSRESRRQVFGKNVRQYEEIVVDFGRAVDGLVCGVLGRVLGEVGVGMGQFGRSCAYWRRRNPGFGILGVRLMEELKGSLGSISERVLTEDEVIEMVKWEIKTYTNTSVRAENLLLKSLIKPIIIEDKLKEKYGIEEEDILNSDVAKNSPAINDLLNTLLELVYQDSTSIIDRPKKLKKR